MGTMSCGMEFSADMHDTGNVPFTSIQKFFELANLPTRDKIKEIKLEFWKDDNRTYALCSMSFKGWISSWTITSGNGSNHVLHISLQPALNKNYYHDLRLGN